MTATKPDVARLNTAHLHVMSLAMQIANDAVLRDIEQYGIRVAVEAPPYPGTWYDVRHLLDEREYAPATIDRTQLALEYALQSGLLLVHPRHCHLVCKPSTYRTLSAASTAA